VDQLSLGVISRSRKENERRLPIHPLHVERIDAGLRERIYLERGYGERFGVPDEQLASSVAGLRSRAELLAECDVILLPRPQPADLAQMPWDADQTIRRAIEIRDGIICNPRILSFQHRSPDYPHPAPK
jgi:alanine dehydrogenase